MTVGGITEYDPAHATYALPPEHAASLTRARGEENVAALTQYLGVWGEQTARRMLAEAGFRDVRTHTVEGDILNVYYMAGKG